MTNKTSTTVFTLATALAAGSLANASERVGPAHTIAAAATASKAQIAASGGRLSGPEIRSLISGHTARMRRGRANKKLFIALSFGADGSVRHTCTAQSVNVGSQHANQCRIPSASGSWAIRGNKLCLRMGQRRCYFVVRRDGRHVFRPASGTGRPYAGRFSVK